MNDLISNNLIKAIKDHYQIGENKMVLSCTVVQLINRPFSSIKVLKLTTSDGDEYLVAKTVSHHSMNKEITERENQALVEFKILQELYPKFQSVENCSVPKPILVIPEYETYLMEYVEGKLLDHELDNARYFYSSLKFKILELNYYNCGNWLKHFHRFTGPVFSTPSILDGIINRTKHRLSLIDQQNDKRIFLDFGSFVSEKIEEAYGKLKDEEISVCGRHGDFGPWNMIAHGEKLTVIDFLGYALEPLAVDLIKMLINFEDEKNDITYNPERINKLKQAFLSGYGPLPQVQEPVLVIIEILYRVSNIFAAISSNRLPLLKRIEKHRSLAKNLEWFKNWHHHDMIWYTT